MRNLFSRLSAVGFSILAGCGTTPGNEEEQGSDAAAFVQFGGDTYRVIDLGLDAETYRELTAPFGEVANVADLGPRESEQRQLRIRIDAHAPASIFEFLLSSQEAAAGVSQHTSFAVLLGGSTKAVGLLVPAVQKVRGVSVQEDGSLTIEIAGAGAVQSIDGGVPQAGGVNVAAGDVNGFMSGERAGQIVSSRLVAAPFFAGADDGFESSAIVVARPESGVPSWFDFTKPVAFAVDIREPNGAIMHRFRLESAQPQPDDGLDITLKPAKAIYIKMGSVDGSSIDDTEEAALVASSYATFNNRAYISARAKLDGFATLDPSGGTPSYDDVVAYWTAAERGATIAALHDAVAHAAEYEGLLCQVAVPTTATLATALAAMPLTQQSATAIATVYEATRTKRDPVAGAYAGGPLAIASLDIGATAPAANVAPACRALVELAPFADGLIASGAVDAKAGFLNQATNLAASPRVLDHELVAWIGLVDAIVAGTVVDNNAARAAAKAKADILIESLSEHEQASASRFDLAQLLVN